MRKLFLIVGLALSMVAVSANALAGELKTVILDVEKMTCSMCPITVKLALKKVDSVTEVTAKYEGDGLGWAKVTYDPDQVTVKDLTYATEMAGYPSHLKQ